MSTDKPLNCPICNNQPRPLHDGDKPTRYRCSGRTFGTCRMPVVALSLMDWNVLSNAVRMDRDDAVRSAVGRVDRMMAQLAEERDSLKERVEGMEETMALSRGELDTISTRLTDAVNESGPAPQEELVMCVPCGFPHPGPECELLFDTPGAGGAS